MMKHRPEYIMSGTFAFLGIMCISSGLAMPNMDNTADITNKVTKLKVTQKRVAKLKNNEIILNDIVLEVNESLSTNIKDYLKKPDDIEASIIKKMTLDTSNVNTTQAGKYTYTITYNKKVFNGNITVKDKESKQVETITLNSLSYEVGTELSKDISTYVKEALTDEVKNAIKIDLSKVDITKAGNYQYSINYNGKLYTSDITIYEPKYGTNSVVIENATTTNTTPSNNTDNTNTEANTNVTDNNSNTDTQQEQKQEQGQEQEQTQPTETEQNENP